MIKFFIVAALAIMMTEAPPWPRLSSCPHAVDGRIARSSSARHEFEIETGHPHCWPGRVVDHVMPLAGGGADAPTNTQWQPIADAKVKDARERCGCGR